MQQKTRKIVFGCLVALNFIMVFAYNYMTPLMSDELLFKADQFHSFADVLREQMQNYMQWNARMVPQLIMNLCYLLPKSIFNLLNSICFVLLSLVIYWNIEKEQKYQIVVYLLGSCMLWLYSVEFGQTILWRSGACNYLWPATIILGFLALFRHNMNCERGYQNKLWFCIALFMFGLLAGWCNENTSGGAILILLCLLVFSFIEHKKIKTWMLFGLSGMIVGYLFLLIAPANRVRAAASAKAESHSGVLRYVARFLKINTAVENYVFPLLIIVIILGTYFLLKKRPLWSMKSAVIFSIASIATCYVLIVIAPPLDRAYFGANLFILVAFLQMVSWIPKEEELLSAIKIGGTICLTILLYFSYISNGANLMRIMREVQDRDQYVAQQIEQGNRNITVPKIRTQYETKYTFIYKNDVEEEADSWGNYLYREYYGVDSIIGVDREDWTEY